MTTHTSVQAPIKFNLSYKVVWGIATLGTSLISGTYGALLPIFYQDYLGLSASWIATASAIYATCYTIIGLVYSALLPEVTESDGERNGLQISASLFGLLGMILGFLIPDFFRPKTGGELTFLPLTGSMMG